MDPEKIGAEPENEEENGENVEEKDDIVAENEGDDVEEEGEEIIEESDDEAMNLDDEQEDAMSEGEKPEEALDEQANSSLFEAVEKPTHQTLEEPVIGPLEDFDASILRRVRLRWAVVRLSFTARKFLAHPHKHVVGLAAIFRFFGALAQELPAGMVSSLLEPLMSPLFRALCYGQKHHFDLSTITCTTQLSTLSNSRRLGFIGALSQHVMNLLQTKLGSNNKEYTQALQHIRKVVMQLRSKRTVSAKQLMISNPEKWAVRREKQNKRKAERQQEKKGKKKKFKALSEN